jgi:glycosyltransferase involved in cell wall biosynthesis/SAM-dependent methyltransferase
VRVLYLVPYPTEGASNRLRIEQYLPHLKRRGLEADVRPFMSPRLYSILYRQGSLSEKLLRLIGSFARRLAALLRANRYDLVVIHRRVFPLWFPFAGALIRRIRRPIIYDFDDAVFLAGAPGGVLGDVSSLLGQSKQVEEILRWSTEVIAGNESLAEYARRLNPNVHILPTPVDTETYQPNGGGKARDGLVIGWIGSHSTSRYLSYLDDAFRELLDGFPSLEIHVVGGHYKLAGYEDRVRNIPWRLDREQESLEAFDIGVMPLKDDVWERYKCGFKALFYMSMGTPVVCSPVGVNTTIIQEGVNGFLAGSTREWIDRLRSLLEDPDLRERMGRQGRLTIERSYSVRANEEGFFTVLETASSRPLRKDAERFRRLQRATQRTLDFKWSQFRNLGPADEAHFLNFIHPVEPEFFQDKLGLDASCGYGRHLYFASRYRPRRMVGMDFSNLIFSARESQRDRSNVSLVKGDLFRMPFRRESFDFVYTLGALQNLPEPERGFRSLLEFVKPGGSVIVWVYSRKRRLMNRIVEAFRFVTLRLPFFTLKKICFLCACVDYSTFALTFFFLPIKVLRRIPLVQKKVRPRIRLYDRYPFWANYSDWFDRLSAPVRTYFDRRDLERWNERGGLVNVDISPTDNYGWRLYGERPKSSAPKPAGREIAAG